VLSATRRVELLERYRVPYRIVGTGEPGVLRLRAAGRAAELISLAGDPSADAEFFVLEGTRFFTALAESDAVGAVLAATGREWHANLPITDLNGVVRANVQRADDGSIVVPFDLDAPLDALLREQYLPAAGKTTLQSLARAVYYRLRPVLPRPLQLALRRRFRARQELASFPAWPTETALHRLEAMLLGFAQQILGRPLPWIAWWPSPFDWALVLTHDVERTPGYDHVPAVRAAERRLGLRSAWYLVPERDYRVEPALLDSLRGEGCEIGLHGLRHDGRDLSRRSRATRFPAMRAYLEQWETRGFRAPATQRDWSLIQELGVEHDSSWSDVARYEPQPGGSCSWVPFFIGDVVELPITLPMDHTLFELLQQDAAAGWSSKTRFLREQGGMALMLTHPDYLQSPDRLETYAEFLGAVEQDETVWHALPGEVASWWRDRAATVLEESEGSWQASGPAAPTAVVRLGAPQPPGGESQP
jgi:peptidoglycan/xylan/chitin deacetylase (PgdA/CDA1 family)